MNDYDVKTVLVRNIFSNSLDNRFTIDSSQCKLINNNYCDFIASFNGTPHQPSNLKLLSAKIGRGLVYNFWKPFYLVETGFPPVLYTPTLGIYTSSNIGTQLSTQLTAISPSGSTYTVTLDAFNARLTFTSTGPTFTFRMNLIDNFNTTRNLSLEQLGFINDFPESAIPTPANPLLAPLPINLSPLAANNFFVHVSGVDNTKNMSTYGLSYTFVIDGSSVSRQISGTTSGTSYHESVRVNSSYNLSEIRITITDVWGDFLSNIQGEIFLVFGYD